MTTNYAALLRGINVGGSRKVPMADLRTLMEDLGHDGVRSYLQSGQAVFTADHGDEESLAAELADAIEQRFGFAVDVIVEDRYAEIDRAAYLPEEFRLGDRALYLYVPDGLGRSKLAEHLSKPRLNKGVIATSRNWNTVVKLVEMTGA